MKNVLPSFPDFQNNLDGYSSLGMMFMLDVQHFMGEKTESSVSEYYGWRLDILKNNRAMIVFDKEHKPLGYVVWDQNKDDIKINHLCAPFGDHLIVLQTLKNNPLFKKYKTMNSIHTKSSINIQKAW